MQFIYNCFRYSVYLAICLAVSVILALSSAYLLINPNLPDPDDLREVQFQIPLRIFSADGVLLGEFGEKRRSPVNIEEVPDAFINALLAAEDSRFYEHQGVDLKGLMRAVYELATTGRIQSGGSTITMQVAKNFFFSSEKTFSRKFNEILLALKIERTFSKDEILEMYVNKIFLGNRAYGIEAAANIYYGKSITELTHAQLAMLAGLPKAPSKFNPIANPARAITRRNWILGRMNQLGTLSQSDYELAAASPVTAAKQNLTVSTITAPYVAEMARHYIVKQFGEDAYTEGLSVYTTVDSKLQDAAQKAIKTGIYAYDDRHGYRKPEYNFDGKNRNPKDKPENTTSYPLAEWTKQLKRLPVKSSHTLAVITKITNKAILCIDKNNQEIQINWPPKKAIQIFKTADYRSPEIKRPSQVWRKGDVIEIKQDEEANWHITQTPKAQAALTSLNPENGAILALVGGQDFFVSKFNRAIQAKRQAGSNFKPLIYAAGLDSGLTAASIINDAPIVFDDDRLEKVWRPENDGGRFFGPTRIRAALYRSRNLVSIRLLQQTGIDNVMQFIERFGIDKSDLPRDLSLSLGSYSLTPLKMASIYATFANGGYQVEPFLISHVLDHNQEELYRAKPKTVCREKCAQTSRTGENIELPKAKRILDARITYILDSILQDVIKRGTATRARVLKRNDIAGKTGTTNGPLDAWFSGYNPDIVTTTWVGFDMNDTLGRREYGGSAALPIWIDYMKVALEDKPERQLRRPQGLVSVLIDPETGERIAPGQSGGIFEIFREENVPELKHHAITNSVDDAFIADELF